MEPAAAADDDATRHEHHDITYDERHTVAFRLFATRPQSCCAAVLSLTSKRSAFINRGCVKSLETAADAPVRNSDETRTRTETRSRPSGAEPTRTRRRSPPQAARSHWSSACPHYPLVFTRLRSSLVVTVRKW